MTDTDTSLSRRYGYSTVVALVIICFIPLSLGLSCAGIFYPSVASALGVGTGVMSYYTSFIWLSATIFLSLMGRLLQRFDARIVLSAAVALVALVFVWLSFAQALWQFYTGAFVMGLGVGMLLFLAPSTLINRWFFRRAGFLLGIVMAFTGIGGMVWSSVGGSLILSLGWTATYRVFAVLSAATLLAALFLVKNSPADKGLLPVGYETSTVKAVSQGAAPANGADTRGQTAQDTTLGHTAAPNGVPASTAFKMPVFFILLAMVFLLNFGMYVYFMIPSYTKSMELSAAMPLIGAVASSVAMAGQTISKLVFGLLGDKYPYACTVTGLVLGILGVALLATGIELAYVICLAAFIFGVYYGLANVMCPILTRLNFGDVDYPRIYSRVSTVAAIANMVSALIWGALIDASGGFMPMFIGVIILLAATIVTVLLIKKKSPVATQANQNSVSM